MDFFGWFNTEHHLSAFGSLTPENVNYGRGLRSVEARQIVLDAAHTQHPERFARKWPEAAQLPKAVWINPPLTEIRPHPGNRGWNSEGPMTSVRMLVAPYYPGSNFRIFTQAMPWPLARRWMARLRTS